jgi:CheY-like chemotaxis protein/anti-sigma regulatory factor (Ser/Thr protein kinase)
VGNFLSFARERPAQRSAVNVNELVETVAELRKFDLRGAKVEIGLNLAADLPATHADGDQLQQVLINLVNNSIQAMHGVVPAPRVLLTTQRVNNLIRVLVEDNGPGVPKDLEPKIFEPFFTTKEVGKGTGLGLSIAHSILMEHHGRIFYQTSALGGAGFVLEIPIVQGAPAQAENQTEFVRREAVPASKPARILVLDDEKSLAEMLGQMLGHLGHTCTLCHHPVQALELVEQQTFDLILSDYRMPIMDGQQFYRRVVQSKPWLASRFIFLTGDVVNEETLAFLRSAGNTYLNKPFRLQEVEATVVRVLSEAESAEQKEDASCTD